MGNVRLATVVSGSVFSTVLYILLAVHILTLSLVDYCTATRSLTQSHTPTYLLTTETPFTIAFLALFGVLFVYVGWFAFRAHVASTADDLARVQPFDDGEDEGRLAAMEQKAKKAYVRTAQGTDGSNAGNNTRR